MEKELIIYCDGGSRGNPGRAASAFVVMENEREVDYQSVYLGTATNNIAEYNALLMAMQWINKNNNNYRDYKFVIIMDSQLVVRQVNGEYKIRNQELKMKAEQILAIKQSMEERVIVKHVMRHKNTLADKLVNQKLDE